MLWLLWSPPLLSAQASNPSATRKPLAVALAQLLNEGSAAAFEAFADVGSASDTAMTSRIGRLSASHVLKYAPPDSLIDLMADEYGRSFSDRELQDLLDFYSSPLGTRIRRTQAELVVNLRRAIHDRLAPHQAELMEQINALVTEKLRYPPS